MKSGESNYRDPIMNRKSNKNTDHVDLKKFFAAATLQDWSVFVERRWLPRVQPLPQRDRLSSAKLFEGRVAKPKKSVPEKLRCACFLWNSESLVKINLPDLPGSLDGKYFKCILTAPPSYKSNALKYCWVVFFNKLLPKVLFCRVGNKVWTTWRYDQDQIEECVFYDAIICSGKLYALNQRGIFFEFETGRLNICLKCCGVGMAFVGCPFKKSQLVDSCGELFLVLRKSIFDIEIFKMDFSERSCIKVSNLGDRNFVLIGNYSVSFCAKDWDLDIGGNKIYFTQDDDEETLYVFDLNDKSLSIYANHPNSGTFWVSHDEMLPVFMLCDRQKGRKVNNKHEKLHEEAIQESKILLCSNDDESRGETESIWFKLKEDTQKLIAQHLTSALDCMNFRAVCKGWRSLVQPLQWKPADRGIPFEYPWLMFSQGENGRYSFYDPICKARHSINIPELENCEVRFSNQGWLLVTKAPKTIFFFEPFTRTTIPLPDLVENYWFDGICFSDSPKSSSWQIFGITHRLPQEFDILYISSNHDDWIYQTIYHGQLTDQPIFPSYANPVFDGEFFCALTNNGNIIYFEFTETRYTAYFEYSSLRFLSHCSRKFLVCYRSELILVVVGQMGRSIYLFELDQKEHRWVPIRSLEKEILYLSQTTCLGVEATDPKMRNTIHFSMFGDLEKDGSNLSYSLKNQRYQNYIDAEICSSFPDLYGTKEFLNGTWIQPLVVHKMTVV